MIDRGVEAVQQYSAFWLLRAVQNGGGGRPKMVTLGR